MLFKNPPKLPSGKDIKFYLQTDLFSWCQDVSTGLYKLDFLQNFENFFVTGLAIAAGDTARITNGFSTSRLVGTVPRGRVIVFQQGNGLVTDGEWTARFVELINNGPADVTISVVFFR